MRGLKSWWKKWTKEGCLLVDFETVKLVRLSICPCGETVLWDSIKLGTEYVVNRASIRGNFFYVCGGCGTRQEGVRVVDAEVLTSGNKGFRPLPAELFGL